MMQKTQKPPAPTIEVAGTDYKNQLVIIKKSQVHPRKMK